MEPKTNDELLMHLSSKGIAISTNSHSLTLKNIGYYHGYKGYRFVKQSSNVINYTDFNQVEAIYEYDSALKALFYPQIIYIETALKSRVLDIVVNDVKSNKFEDIFKKTLDDYKRFSLNNRDFPNNRERQKAQREYDKAVNDRNELRVSFLKITTKAYQNGNSIAVHYQKKDQEIPIWGIFEMISLGEFGHFVRNANFDTRKKISLDFNINQIYDTSAEVPHKIIFAIKDLRNAIAHNNVIFDTRFKTADVAKSVKTMIYNETDIEVQFNSIFDYLVLIVFILKKLCVGTMCISKLISDFENMTEIVRSKLPISIYNLFTFTNLRNNIAKLYEFIN